MPILALYLGAFLGAVVGLLAFWAGALTAGGAVAAAVVGATIFGFGGLPAAIVCLVFFGSSSGLTRFKAQPKKELKLGFAKGGRRDAVQVWANGGVATLCMLVYGWVGSPLALAGFLGAFAVATADTWGTEVGVLSKQLPISILTGQPVPRGTSGGLSMLGTSASAVGGLLIGIFGYFVLDDGRAIPMALIGGLGGAIFDSLLGARWQVMYSCPSCNKPTESHPTHDCGSDTRYMRGWRWLNNDGVNFLATCVGAMISIGLALRWI